jgi:hypothetical protein
MSHVEGTPVARPPDHHPPPRHGCLTALMVLVGIIFLLPGVCTLVFSGGNFRDPMMSTIALVTFVIVMGGVVLIALALRGQR